MSVASQLHILWRTHCHHFIASSKHHHNISRHLFELRRSKCKCALISECHRYHITQTSTTYDTWASTHTSNVFVSAIRLCFFILIHLSIYFPFFVSASSACCCCCCYRNNRPTGTAISNTRSVSLYVDFVVRKTKKQQMKIEKKTRRKHYEKQTFSLFHSQ